MGGRCIKMVKCKCCNGGSEKKIRVSFCPKCKSRSVKYIFGFGNLFGVVPKMRCGDCGFEMNSFPVLITSDKALRETIAKMKKAKKKRVVKKK